MRFHDQTARQDVLQRLALQSAERAHASPSRDCVPLRNTSTQASFARIWTGHTSAMRSLLQRVTQDAHRQNVRKRSSLFSQQR